MHAASILLVMLTVAAEQVSPQPKWIVVPQLRAVQTRNSVVNDVDSCLSALESQTYRSQDPGNWAHEGTHGLNSRIRNKYGRGTGQDNAFYVLNGRAAIVAEPPTTLSNAARYVPPTLRAAMFKQHMQDARQWWDKQPLYVMDEWVAYTHSTLAAIEECKAGRNPSSEARCVRYMLEAAMNSLAVCVAIDAEKRAGRLHYDNAQLRLFVAWQWSRMMYVWAEAQKYPQLCSHNPAQYYMRLISGQDKYTNGMRAWAQGYFGKEWCRVVMRF